MVGAGSRRACRAHCRHPFAVRAVPGRTPPQHVRDALLLGFEGTLGAAVVGEA